MVAAEEERIKERETAVKQQEDSDAKKGKKAKKHADLEHEKKDSKVRAP